MPRTSSLHLNVFVGTTGHHEASWRYRKTQPERLGDVRYYQELAAVAERGKFDSFFLGDSLALGQVKYKAEGRMEPLMLLAAIATHTNRIGLVATASTTYAEPYNLARQFATLDHISAGRAGWNIVTSWAPGAVGNFGLERPREHAARYARAAEFLDVVTKLWDSWEDDAYVIDREAGIYVDPERVHRIDHEGANFQVGGALNVSRSPQGRPMLIQAGSSEDGRAFAASYAEAIFTAQQELSDAQAFYADMKARAAAAGRDPDGVSILPGLCPIVGSTEAEARATLSELNDLMIPEFGLRQLSLRFNGIDLSGYALDGPVPLHVFPRPNEVVGPQSRSQLIFDAVERDGLTLRQLLRLMAGAQGHRTLAGTPEQIADHIVQWVGNGAADGFNIMPPYLPTGLSDFVDQVVPLLQKRGVFRKEYEGTTLREHYGLSRPKSRYAP